ncbi:MAG TPA: hypothetical protein VFF25_02155 [Clostridia bacterium]|nr:hypothetical protein [Clostridia bacterium]
MSGHGKYSKYLVALILTISLSANLFFVVRLRILKQRVLSSNTVTSTKLESAIRDTMYSIKELAKADTEGAMNDLQLSVQQLALIFNNWIDLNQSEKNPKEPLTKGLGALETLRNTVIYHLGNRYNNNNKQLMSYDMVFLDKVYEKLDRLLVIYNSIERRIDKIKSTDDKDNGGLCQWAANMDEVSRLYRHSRIPNEHPEYIQLGPALTKVGKIFPILESFRGSKKAEEAVQIRDGVHYYEIDYYYGDELSYLVWIDAIDGSLRLFEDHTGDYNGRTVFKEEALNIAKNFMSELESYSKVIDSMSVIFDKDSKNTIYAFQFIPVSEDTAIVSDCVDVNISSKGGNIIKYSSSFSNTEVPDIGLAVALEDLEEEHREQFINMEYDGLSVVRSFFTNYKPVIAYNYKSTEKESTTKLYFDVATGNQIYESYSVYESIPYVMVEDCD